MEQRTKFPGRLRAHGITREVYYESLRRGLKWCSAHKAFEPKENFRSHAHAQSCIEGTKRNPEELHAAVCRVHKVTPEWYAHKLAEQKGVCALCESDERFNHFRTGKPPRLAIDHNHRTKKPRGLLCLFCNRQLGYVEILLDMTAQIESRPGTWLEKAIAYLEQYKES